LGHKLHAEIEIAVDDGLSVRQLQQIVADLKHELRHHMEYLGGVTVSAIADPPIDGNAAPPQASS
jgi:divalent metal cation (Fe/Co/Zn/Cd) transporter